MLKSFTLAALLCALFQPPSFGADAVLSGATLFQPPAMGAGSVDITKLLPDCPPTKCTADVWILAVADFTGDGLPDILLGTTLFDRKYNELNKAGPIMLMKNMGHGHFALAPFADGKTYILRDHPRSAVVADFNGDGKADVAIASNGYDVAPWAGEQNLLLLQDDGTLRDATANLPHIVAMHHGLAVGDFAGNGHQDIFVITNHGQSRQNSYFLVNDGTGHFTKSDLSDRFPPSFLHNETGVGQDRSKYDAAVVADLDGDGKPDILLAQSGDDPGHASKYAGFKDSRIVFGDGSGKWPRKDTFQFTPGPWKYATFVDDFAVADIDGDGRPDIVAATQRRGSGYEWLGQRLRVFINKGNRTFQDVTATSLWDQSQWDNDKGLLAPRIFLVDINGDKSPDIVVSDLAPIGGDKPGQFPFEVALNDGHGHFTPVDPATLSPSFHGRHLWPIDALGDGRTDLVGLSLVGDSQGDDFFTRGAAIDLYISNIRPK